MSNFSRKCGTDYFKVLNSQKYFIKTLKLLENEAESCSATIGILENFLGQSSLKSTLSLINGDCVYFRGVSGYGLAEAATKTVAMHATAVRVMKDGPS